MVNRASELTCFLIIFLLCGTPPAAAQDLPVETRYEWLMVRVEVSLADGMPHAHAGQLLEEAQQLAEAQEFDLAVLYLEELLAIMEHEQSHPDRAARSDPHQKKAGKFTFSVIGGIDYNHQEFEVGYFQDDSTILEEIRNPYTGFMLRYNADRGIEIQSVLRFDQQNYRNDLHLRWVPAEWLDLHYTNYWNHAREFTYNSFIENGLDLRAGTPLSQGLRWHIENNFRYKAYTGENPYSLDYYRNRLQLGLAGIGWNTQYYFERYENLGGEETDYRQHLVRGNLLGSVSSRVSGSITTDGILRDYVLKLGDSLAVNRFSQIGLYLAADVELTSVLRMGIEENYLFKSYRTKSPVEPDYHLNYLRPMLALKTGRHMEFTAGIEWELKRYLCIPDDPYDVSEQNYNAAGFTGGISYMSPDGAYLMINAGYQWRRYPDSISKEILSLYTDRNIFSAMVTGYLPLTDSMILNLFALFDDDQDVDFDQQNNQSTIFTLEIEYRF